MKLPNKTIQKLISALMVIGVLAPSLVIFSVPKQADAQLGVVVDFITELFTGTTAGSTGVSAVSNTTSTAIQIRNAAKEIGKQVLMAAAKRLLAEVTKSTVNWINSGFHGKPLFLENTQSFFQDIAKTQVKTMVEMIGYDTLRFPFGKQQALNIISGYKTQFENNAQYTLSTVISDPALLASYRNDFNVGGWDGFLMNTQYPQNNYIGSTIQIQQNLAGRLEGTIQSPANKVQSLLQQGMGFLSPQTCPSNPRYNNLSNEFDKPTFKTTLVYDDPRFPAPKPNDSKYSHDPNGQANYLADLKKYSDQYDRDVAMQKVEWNKTNTCPGGLVNTTPGSVVASQLNISLGSGVRQKELAAAMGNSLSAVFDALINKVMSTGLNALTKSINPPPKEDDFSYDGQTLGSPSENVNGNVDVFNGPEEEIVLEEFKRDVQTGIDNTVEELALMTNIDPNNPGISQLLMQIPQQSVILDKCLPGPDKGWEERLQSEMDRNLQTISKRVTDQDQLNLAREFKYTVSAFKDWVINKMMGSLPGAIIYMDAIKDLDNTYQQTLELTDRKRADNQTLLRLKAISQSLSSITTQPAPDSTGEKDLITIRKSYNAVKNSIPSSITIEDNRSERQTLKEKLSNLDDLVIRCEKERTDTKWEIPGGIDSRLQTEIGKTYTYKDVGLTGGDANTFTNQVTTKTTTGTEIEQFCELPIIGGYGHGERIKTDETQQQNDLLNPFLFNPLTDPVLYDEGQTDGLPMVNAKRILGISLQVDMNCKIIFNSNKIEYTHAGAFGF